MNNNQQSLLQTLVNKFLRMLRAVARAGRSSSLKEPVASEQCERDLNGWTERASEQTYL